MANKKPCGTCRFMWPLKKGKRGGGTITLTRGLCLKRTIFPKNRPGNHVYPPGAIIKDIPNNVAKTHVVRKEQVVTHCTLHQEK